MAGRRLPGGSRSRAAAPAPPSRRWRPWLGGLAAAALAAGGALAWRSGEEYLRTCQRFDLQALEVRGLQLMRGSEILDATGLTPGDNVFCVDLDSVAARVDTMVWVRRARVVRKPPDRLVVHVQERRRLAWLEIDDRLYGVDGDGVLLPGRRQPLEERADLDLPVLRPPSTWRVRSADSTPLAPGVALTDSSLLQVLGWWRRAREANATTCASISEIQPFGDGAVRLFLVGDGLEVRLPMAEAGRHLAVLEELLGRVYRECPDAAYVDLRYAGQAVVGRRGTAARAPGGGEGHG